MYYKQPQKLQEQKFCGVLCAADQAVGNKKA